MAKKINEIASLAGQGKVTADAIFERIFAAAQSGAVFSQPVVSGNYTVITACEVTSGGGFGSGSGYGQNVSAKPAAGEGEASSDEQEPAAGGGGGMGGGGGSLGRPIAVIVIGPDGVEVKPIVDMTKLAIAVVTSTLATIAAYRKFHK